MREHDNAWRFALLLGCAANDIAQLVRHQRFNGVCRVTDHDRHWVAESTFEFARSPRRFSQRATFGRVADEHFSVFTNQDDRRSLHGIGTERKWFRGCPPRDSGGGIGGAEVDTQ